MVMKDLPREFKEVFEVLERHSFFPILVGGIPRDFLLTGKVGHDFDIEVQSISGGVDLPVWEKFYLDLSNLGPVQKLNYEILKLKLNDFEFELSPPRREVFNDKKGHSNFEAQFDFSLDFSISTLRRDFTVNAIGFKFNSLADIEILDPHEGVKHLKEKLLYPVSDSFYKDPIRYLRSYRFKQKLGFEFSESLKVQLQQTDLSEVSHVHFFSEMGKTLDPYLFLEETKIIKTKFLDSFDKMRDFVLDEKSLEAWLLAFSWVGEDAKEWQSFFKLSPDQSARIEKWVFLSKKLDKVSLSLFKDDFEKVLLKNEFNELFEWYGNTKNLLAKFSFLNIFIQKNLESLRGLLSQSGPLDLEAIPVAHRAKFQLWNLCQKL